MANVGQILHKVIVAVAASKVTIVADIISESLPANVLRAAGIVISNEIPRAALTKLIDEPLGGKDFAERLIARYGQALDTIKAGLVQGFMRGDGIDAITKFVGDKLG
jgi:hypothetical protein